MTTVGDDPFGDYVRQALAGFGVDASRVGTHPTLRTPLAFCEILPPDHFPLLFYREPKAPDLELELDEAEAPSRRRCSGRPAPACRSEPSRSRTRAALAGARPSRASPCIDLDYRAMFWTSAEQAGHWNREALAHATVAVGNTEEVAVALGEELEPADAAVALLDLGLDLAIVKLGGDGVLGATREESVVVPAFDVEVVNGLGAGDAFGGALCHGLLLGVAARAHAALRERRRARSSRARLGCADDMPTADEVEALCAA